MEAESVKEFVNNLTIQDEMVRYNGHLYYFYGCVCQVESA